MGDEKQPRFPPLFAAAVLTGRALSPRSAHGGKPNTNGRDTRFPVKVKQEKWLLFSR